MAAAAACRAHYLKATGGEEVSALALLDLIAGSPAATHSGLTERLITEFFEGWLAEHHMGAMSLASSPTAAPPKGAGSRLGLRSPRTLLNMRSRSKSPASPPAAERGRNFGCEAFVEACADLSAFATETTSGMVIVGNGRSVLGAFAGATVDRFATVVRFNDYQLEGFEQHVGVKTDLWVVSDWTCVKLLGKYPERTLPVLVAVPYRFMGKPYYHERRAELETELSASQLSRVTFVPCELVRQLVDENRFGDRWPSSGLITIVHMLAAAQQAGGAKKLYLHGFDFFKEIGA